MPHELVTADGKTRDARRLQSAVDVKRAKQAGCG
jgi:hypothetical protein